MHQKQCYMYSLQKSSVKSKFLSNYEQYHYVFFFFIYKFCDRSSTFQLVCFLAAVDGN